jgi:hypothetical protein
MPANLKGLNVVQPQQASSDSQDLLSGQSFPDISAQLDLWTNLTFDVEDNNPTRRDEDKLHLRQAEGDENEAKLRASIGSENAVQDGHADSVTAANLSQNAPRNSSQSTVLPPLQSFDLNALLSGIGFDPYAHLAQQANANTITPSLAQLLALHSQNQIQPFSQYAVPSSTTFNPMASPHQNSLAPPSSSAAMPETGSLTSEEPQTKRSRTRKTSVSSSDTLSPDVQTVTIAAAEDKRRRNTAASARFRLKKKEREAALEGKAKELEARVSELERECEGLRRENGWLKGLVVGVTGAAQAPVVTSPPSPLTSVQLASLASASPRRNRDDSNN